MTTAAVVRASVSSWFNNRVARKGNERLIERVLLLAIIGVTMLGAFALFGHTTAHSLTVSGQAISQIP